MKLDMMKAWEGASARITANLSLIATLAGTLVFLPIFAFGSILNRSEELKLLKKMQGKTPNPEVIFPIMEKFLSQYWWLFIIIIAVQILAKLSLITLVGDETRPTMAESIGKGAKQALPYFISAFVFILGVCFVGGIVIAGASLITASEAVAALIICLLMVAFVYVSIKVTLLSSIFCLTPNPTIIGSLKTSWAMTKGNSARILGFYLLVGILYVVASSIATLILTLPFALAGAEVALIGEGAVGALSQAVAMVLFACIEVEIFRQLAPNSETPA